MCFGCFAKLRMIKFGKIRPFYTLYRNYAPFKTHINKGYANPYASARRLIDIAPAPYYGLSGRLATWFVHAQIILK